MIAGIRHIIFDLGVVLLDIEPARTRKALQDLGIRDLDKAWAALEADDVFNRLETGHMEAADFLEALRRTSGLPLSDEELTACWNALLLDFPLRRLQILQQLQLYYDLVLLSNTNSIHETCFNNILQRDHGIPNLGVFFDRVYYSHRLGLRKPDPQIFLRVLEDCGFRPEQTLFIDDIEQNVQAAAALGIQTIWLQPHMSIEKIFSCRCRKHLPMDKTIQVSDRRFKLLLPADTIQERVAALGRRLSAELAGKDPLFLVVLNGAFMFASDLMKHISIPATVSFIRLASYEGTASTGKVTLVNGLQEPLSGRHVVLLEDIIDTGTTLHYFLPELHKQAPASVQVAACFTKPDALLFTDAAADHSCFSLPGQFVVGYGMDYNGYGRNYPDLYEVLPE